MAKNKGKRQHASQAWSHEEHSARVTKRLASMAKKCEKEGKDLDEKLEKGYKRSALAHDSRDKIDNKKLFLHLAHLQREIDKLRENLTHWDEVEELSKVQKQRQEEQASSKPPLTRAEKAARKRQKMHPSNWKLRGAARPAWEVYDFDTRYVCPHSQSDQEAKERAKRVQNIFYLHKGHFGGALMEEDVVLQSTCRTFLSLLMQYGTLCVEAKRFKSARNAFIECMELEGDDTNTIITTARSRLMRMYLEQNRPDSARRLFERLPQDRSAWVRYGAALVEFVSWNLLNETSSTEQTSVTMLHQAMEANIFCAYYLAFHETFSTFMEYTEDIEDAEPGTVEEAIEYCSSEQVNLWLQTEGALDWLRTVLLRADTSCENLNWKKMLDNAERKAEEDTAANEILDEKDSEEKPTGGDPTDIDEESISSSCEQNSNADHDEKFDLKMYLNMFRMAMEMINDSGALHLC